MTWDLPSRLQEWQQALWQVPAVTETLREAREATVTWITSKQGEFQLMHYFYLALAVLGEVIGTSFLKATEDFTKLWPSLIVVVGYGAAFYFLTLSLKVIPVGIAYATWSGIGIVLVTVISIFLYKQVPDWPAIIGMAMIIGGVVIMQLFSKTLHL